MTIYSIADELAAICFVPIKGHQRGDEFVTEARLDDRVLVVTGASSGIGFATAEVCAQLGATVVLMARRGDRLTELQRRITAKGGNALALETDITDVGALSEAARSVQKQFNRADGVINNAGVMLLSEFEAADTEGWGRMISTNLVAPIHVINSFLPQLMDGGGDIINISSVAGRRARPTGSVYSATKWGLQGFTEGLRQELAPKGIRVMVIEPGAVRTELADHIFDETVRRQTQALWEEWDALIAHDVAETIAFALSRPRRMALSEILIRPTAQVY
jgi:clavulanate-9-aldehyde reductase